MSQAKCGLAGINSGAEQFELEPSLEIPELCRGRGLDAESSLTDAEVHIPIRSELIGEGRQFRGPHYVKPVRIVLSEVVAGVEHDEAIQIDRVLLGDLLLITGSRSGRSRLRVLCLQAG